MKILVCISVVPDTTTKIRFEEDGSSIKTDGVKFVINPYCEYGLSKAIGFREEGKEVSITTITVDSTRADESIRKALAIGADDAVRIDAAPSDAAFVASQIADYAKDKDFDLIFTGKESIDFNGGMVPGMLAEHLDLPFVSFATHMELTGEKSADVKREVDGGSELLGVNLPAVISCQKGIAEWRIPNMRGIMAARRKPFEVVAPTESQEIVKTVKLDYPPSKGDTQYFDPENAGGLVTTLSNKGLI